MKTKTKRFLVQIGKLIIAMMIVGAIGAGGYCIMKAGHEPWGLIILAAAIVISGWLALSALHYICNKKAWVAVLLFFALYSYSVYTYRDIHLKEAEKCSEIAKLDENVKILSPINNTLSIFFPSRGSYDETGNDSIHFQAIHLLSYLFFAMLAFSIFGRRLINRSRYPLITYSHRNIFWGDSPGGMLLAQHLIETTIMQQAIFVVSETIKEDEEKDKALFERIDSMGAIALYRNFQKKNKMPRGEKHFFLTEDQDFNVIMALKVVESHQQSKRKIKLYVRTEMENIGHLFPAGSNIEVNIFNQSDLTARQFVQNKPMLDLVPAEKKVDLKVDYNFRVLVLGFGWTGREMLNKTICDSQFVGSSFEATILDKDFYENQGDYPLLYDECIKEYNLSFESKEISTVGSSASYQWLEDNIKNYDRIFVTLGDDNLNLEAGIAIYRLFFKQGLYDTKSKVFVHIKDAEMYCYKTLSISLFGRLDDIYTVDVVINEQMDTVAKLVHFFYMKGLPETIIPSEVEALWNRENNIFNRDSSRAVAMNVKNTIALFSSEDGFDKIVSNPSAFDILAENEHLRWNAFHYTKGVRRWDLSAISEKETESKKKEAGILLYHSCLIKFSELGKVDDKINLNRKQFNIDNTIKISKGEIESKPDIDMQENDRKIVRQFKRFYQILKSNENK